MLPIKDRVKLIKDSDMYWDWDDSVPRYLTKTTNSKYGGIHLKFDPFPCYTHNYDLVTSELERIEKIFPIGFDVFIFIFPYESLSRTNGQAYVNTIEYQNEEKNQKWTWDGVIDLYGKRIVPHPSMTKYLVSHERGHIIDDWICLQRGLNQSGMDEEYAKLRGIDFNTKYGGRNWHSNVGEILCNDIRICLFNSELEFWPHDCEHPLKNQKVINFWNEMRDKYAYKP